MGVFVRELPDLFELPQDLTLARRPADNLARGRLAGLAENAFAFHARSFKPEPAVIQPVKFRRHFYLANFFADEIDGGRYFGRTVAVSFHWLQRPDGRK